MNTFYANTSTPAVNPPSLSNSTTVSDSIMLTIERLELELKIAKIELELEQLKLALKNYQTVYPTFHTDLLRTPLIPWQPFYPWSPDLYKITRLSENDSVPGSKSSI